MPAFDAADAGLLLVFSEPGDALGVDEYNDWYDNEHIPLRTSSFPDFLSAARYTVVSTVASASSRPYTQAKWAAIYDIASLSLFDPVANPAYAALRTVGVEGGRSKREQDVLDKIGVLDRRIYRLTFDSSSSSSNAISKPEARPTSPRPTRASATAPVLVATSVTPAQGNQEAYDEWYLTEHVPALARVPGWRRTRRFELVDALVNGRLAAGDNADGETVPRCLGLHEYDSPDFASTPEFAAALNTPWRTRVMGEDGSGIAKQERRVMHLLRAWEPEAALRKAGADPPLDAPTSS